MDVFTCRGSFVLGAFYLLILSYHCYDIISFCLLLLFVDIIISFLFAVINCCYDTTSFSFADIIISFLVAVIIISLL